MAHQNMTTLCENFACTFHEAGGGSQNHIMLGGWDAWLLSSVGGLDSSVNGSTGDAMMTQDENRQQRQLLRLIDRCGLAPARHTEQRLFYIG